MRTWPTLVAVLALVSSACGGPAALTPDEIVAAFVAKTNDPARTYHSDLTGTYRNDQVGGPRQNLGMTMTASFDYQGASYAGTITTQMGGGIAGGMTSTVSYATIGDMAWIRYENGPWERAPVGAASAPPGMDALSGLAATDVAYEAAETIDDQPLHRLRITDPAAALTRAFDGGIETGMLIGPGSEYVVYVDGEGVPVAAQSHVVGSMSFGEGMPPVDGPPLPQMPEMSFAFDFNYRYSAWGSDITIVPPAL